MVEFRPPNGDTGQVYQRSVIGRVMEALADTPVVLLHGARQVGKSTLAAMVVKAGYQARYLTLDDPGVFAAARTDPVGFVAGLAGPVILDEWQRVPELARAIKREVDERREPGRFLLTGSTSSLVLPSLSESLAGRMEIITLWPLSQGEIEGKRGSLVDVLFRPELIVPSPSGSTGPTVAARLVRGGYPVAVARTSPGRRNAWFSSYVTSILQRDIRDLASIERLSDMSRLLALLAARSASLLNYTELAGALGMPQTTVKRYVALLQAVFLVQLLPAWSRNRGRRLAKASKVLMIDTGLASYLVGVDEQRLARERTLLGSLVESFVLMEMVKQLGWSETSAIPLHYRDHTGHEVDLVLEGRDGRVVGIEIKAGATVGSSDFRGLRRLAELAGGDFVRGVLLYAGRNVIPFGERLHAVPLESVWETVG
jgi:predicted AAA+ superfamily ATPase